MVAPTVGQNNNTGIRASCCIDVDVNVGVHDLQMVTRAHTIVSVYCVPHRDSGAFCPIDAYAHDLHAHLLGFVARVR